MGEIWIADHLTLATQVAVKLIVAELADVTLAVERFEREARLVAQLDTPHVAHHFDHGITTGGSRYIVMELLHGQALDERCDQGPLDLTATLQILEQVGSALECAALRGIVHRDVKPENIFLCKTASGFFCKLLDFGVSVEPLVARHDSLTMPGALVGTPSHMSPEMVLGTRGAHHQDDLWALATVAYECLLGTEPFQGATVGAVCAALASGQYVPPSEVDPEVGPYLDRFFATAFAMRPEDRFDTVSALLTALHDALAVDAADSTPVVMVTPTLPIHEGPPTLPAGDDAHGDTLPSVTSLDLDGPVLPLVGHPWAVVAGVVTVAVLALPLLVRPHPSAGQAASSWATSAAEAAPALAPRESTAVEPLEAPREDVPNAHAPQPIIQRAVERAPASGETRPHVVPAHQTPPTAVSSVVVVPSARLGRTDLVPRRDLGF